jgi:hypothetical protein
MSRRDFVTGLAGAAMTAGRPLGAAGRADHPAPLRADIDGEEYPQRRDPTAYARSLLETLDTLTPEQRHEFRKLIELGRRDRSGLGEP